jgi:hypothetical protein
MEGSVHPELIDSSSANYGFTKNSYCRIDFHVLDKINFFLPL